MYHLTLAKILVVRCTQPRRAVCRHHCCPLALLPLFDLPQSAQEKARLLEALLGRPIARPSGAQQSLLTPAHLPDETALSLGPFGQLFSSGPGYEPP
mmetsp:Transcript_8176/g.15947  ORF Transcript_8176/g.15947 Transcript_8176/m.15947 type:complete len:97 (+) Transcript_8176:204-494(+)